MGAGSSMLLNAVFSRSSLTSTALSLTVFSLCVCCSVLVCVGVCDAAVRSLTAAVPLSWHLSSVLICWARCCCVYENVHYFACVLVCSFSLSRCRCFIGLSFTTRLLCVYSFSTRVHVCAFICAVFRYCCSLSHGVCITSEPSYAGVLLQGSACYILSCVRYGTHFVVYGMRSF